jgi:hypothetical protein
MMLKVTRTTVETIVDKNDNFRRIFKFEARNVLSVDEAYDWVKAKEKDLEVPCSNLYFSSAYDNKGTFILNCNFSEAGNADIAGDDFDE